MEVDPASRYTATKALDSPWIKSVDKSSLYEHDLANSLSGISKTSHKLKGLVKTVQWIQKDKKKFMSSLTVDGVDDLDTQS